MTDELRNRIIERFAARAEAGETRTVRMNDVARDVGVATAALYDHFAGKAELVDAVVRRWADEHHADLARTLEGPGNPVEQVIEAATSFGRNRRFSAEFVAELERAYPSGHERYLRERSRVLRRWGRHLRPHLRDDVPPGWSFDLLALVIRHALDVADSRGHDPAHYLRVAIGTWANGALAPEPGDSPRRVDRNVAPG